MRWRNGLVLTLVLLVPVAAFAHDKEVEGGEIGGTGVLPLANCDEGDAGSFPCLNVDLLSAMPTGLFGLGLANDVWGWTDRNSGREFAILGLRGGTAFVDLSHPDEPVYLGVLRTGTINSSWRDIKTYRDHAFIVSEAFGHGLQIFDLSELLDVTSPPVEFTPTAWYREFGNSHNLAINVDSGIAFAVGTRTCSGGLHMVDVTRPTEPRFAGCFSEDGYTHDAQCVIYHGPDLDHQNREICINSNEDTVTVVDVTNPDAPVMLSRTGYEGSAYTHQGWLSEDHGYFFLGDEIDERRHGHNARTYVWNLQDLDAPFVVGHYTGPRSIDHNIFAMGNHVFEANYVSGLRVLRMGDLSRGELAEVAYFDSNPEKEDFSFSGAWGVYPFFESGVVLLSDINRGLFVLRPDLSAVPECSDGLDNDADGLTDFPLDSSCEDRHGGREAPRSDVAIDVKSGNGPVINPTARGVLKVAVLGSALFDVESIDVATLRLGPGETRTTDPGPKRADVNGDGYPDLWAQYSLRDAGLAPDAQRVCLRWETRDALAYGGCEAIVPVPAMSRAAHLEEH